jgi:hypothetical protein
MLLLNFREIIEMNKWYALNNFFVIVINVWFFYLNALGVFALHLNYNLNF